MNCIVIEDEPAAQSILEHNISLCPGLNCMGIFPDAFAAQSFLDHHTVDLMFLDINLPEMSGVSFLKSLVHPPLVIFTTAYEHFAAKAFEVEAVDYLLKPFDERRLARALSRLPLPERQSPPLTKGDTILLKVDGECLLLPVETIDLMVTTGNTTEVFWGSRSGKVNKPMKYLVKKLDSTMFFRVTRDQLINLRNLISLKTNAAGLIEAKFPHKREVTFSRRQSLLFRKSHKI